MASSIERLLLRFQDNRASIAKWAAIVAIAWAAVVLVLAVMPEVMIRMGSDVNPQLILTAVRYSMLPALLAGVAWGTARSVRSSGARRANLLAMGAVWFCLLVVFVSQVQYYRLTVGADKERNSTQTEQTHACGLSSCERLYV